MNAAIFQEMNRGFTSLQEITEGIRLTPAQEALLMRWGSPYVMDEFRFHMTLTGRLAKARMAPAQPGHESSRRLDRARAWYNRYGYWSLLASWVPIVGDPLTLVAGAMREPFWRFLAIVTLAKSGRYAALAAGLVASGLHG